MAKNFAEIAFSPAAKALQETNGSRRNYEHVEKTQVRDGLTQNEIEFLGDRDSFYLASIGANGFPYIQHRGGPKGFLKILDSKRIAFVDFKGNMQYISVGNIATENKVALILVDYPAKARLKIYARAEIVELKDNPNLLHLLTLGDYKSRPDRMMILHIEAYDWNCPQHITPRYTVEEIEEAFSSQHNRILQMEEEIENLKTKLKNIKAQ